MPLFSRGQILDFNFLHLHFSREEKTEGLSETKEELDKYMGQVSKLKQEVRMSPDAYTRYWKVQVPCFCLEVTQPQGREGRLGPMHPCPSLSPVTVSAFSLLAPFVSVSFSGSRRLAEEVRGGLA